MNCNFCGSDDAADYSYNAGSIGGMCECCRLELSSRSQSQMLSEYSILKAMHRHCAEKLLASEQNRFVLKKQVRALQWILVAVLVAALVFNCAFCISFLR